MNMRRRIARARQKHEYREEGRARNPSVMAAHFANTLSEKVLASAQAIKTSSSSIISTLKTGAQTTKSVLKNNLNTIGNLINYGVVFSLIPIVLGNHEDHVPKEQCDPFDLGGVCLAFMFNIVVNGVTTPVHAMMSYYGKLMTVHDPRTGSTYFPKIVGDFIHDATAQCVNFCTERNITYTTRCIMQGWEFDPSKQPRYYAMMINRAAASFHESQECEENNGTSLVQLPYKISACLSNVALGTQKLIAKIQTELHKTPADPIPPTDPVVDPNHDANGWGWGAIIAGLGITSCVIVTVIAVCKNRIQNDDLEIGSSPTDTCSRISDNLKHCFASVCSFFRGLCEHEGSSGRVRKKQSRANPYAQVTGEDLEMQSQTAPSSAVTHRPTSRSRSRGRAENEAPTTALPPNAHTPGF